ncbi:hypothetical protein pEaSNUABM11_00062 [Erwinia phage pEa_SNUABM_11]|nr:hypothetical protein pEaSNUABM11_00062 [Erwinia phage pEa_SNUABM_11]
MDTYATLKSNMLLLAHNPAAMQTLQLNQLAAVEENNQVVLKDPTDPVVFLAEMGVMLAHSSIQSQRELLPKVYPSMATTYDDLFRHMSDTDYVDVFAQPTSVPMLLYFDVDSILSKAMPLVYDGVRKVTIPRDTVFSVAGYQFAIQYPIEIRVLPYGTTEQPAFQVVWLTDLQSPITPVSTNALDWVLTSAPNTTSQLLGIRIPMLQYSVSSEGNLDTVTGTNQYVMDRTFTNLFFYARVWMMASGSSSWVEIEHTHSRDVYDPNVATGLIQISGQNIRLTIPSIYLQTGLVSGTIRLDIYTTLGPMSVDISSYSTDQFQFAMKDFNGEVSETYSNPIKNFSVKQLAAEVGSVTTGGRAALTFEELRDRVVNNSVGQRQLPITLAQATATASDSGLDLSVPIDYVTGRTFHLSSGLPDSTVKGVSSPIGSLTAPLLFSWDELANLSTVRVNDNRLTILPDTIYRYTNSSLTVDTQMTELAKTMRSEDLINIANATSYLFTPFHYVVDINNTAVDVRIYQLDKPQVTGKRFIDTNVTTALSVVSGNYELVATDTGYALRIVTKSESSYKNLADEQCFAQISYVPRGYTDQYAYINGTLIGYRDDERVWEFPLETNLDVDRNDELVLTNTRLASASATPVPVALEAEFNVFFGVTGYYPGNYERATMDNIIVVPSRDAIGVTQEIYTIQLGKALSSYWRKARPQTDGVNYKYYQEDVLSFYEADVLKYKPGTTAVPEYTYDPETQTIEFVYEHRKGDPVLTDDGFQEIKYPKGSLMKDANGDNIIDKPRSLIFRSEMPVYDARYKFATDTAVQTYLQSVIDYIVNIVTVTIPGLAGSLIDQTEAFFVPVTTMGYISARTEDGTVTPISAENRFTVSYYMTAANRQNTDLLKIIRTKTSKVINDYLIANKTVSTTDLGIALKNELLESIIGVEVGGMGPDSDWRIFTVVGDASQATIGKVITLEADGTLKLKDDIVLAYNRHDTDAS